MNEPSADTVGHSTEQTLVQLVSELNGPLRSSLSALSTAATVVASHGEQLPANAQRGLALLRAEVQWHQTLWMHLLTSLDRAAHRQEPVPLPARPSGPPHL